MKWIKTSAVALCALLCGCNEADKFSDLVLPGTVEFEYETHNVPENVASARIPVLLSAVAARDVQLSISIANRSDLPVGQIAAEGVNFEIPAKQLTIPRGETYGYFPLSVVDDIAVNEDRMFDVKIESISDGAEPARISQVCRVVIRNNDFWPEVNFEKPQFAVPGTDTRMVLPLAVGGGVIRNPFRVTVTVESVTATEGTDFSIEQKEFTFTEESRTDSIVINLTAPEDMAGDMAFKLRYEVNEAGITGTIPETEVVIKKVIKYVGFQNRMTRIFQRYEKALVPISFTGLKTSRDVSARIRVKSVEGIAPEDILLPSETITTKGDTVSNFEVTIVNSFEGNLDAAFELEIEEVTDGELGAITTTWIRVAEGVDLDRSTWEVLSYSTEEPTGESGGANGRYWMILDNNLNTFWHTQWQGTGSYPAPPHQLTVGFGGQVIDVESVRVLRRQASNTNTKTVEIYLATDQQISDFVLVGSLAFPNNTTGLTQNGMTLVMPYFHFKAYGMRVRMPDSNTTNGVCSLAEVYVNGLVTK